MNTPAYYKRELLDALPDMDKVRIEVQVNEIKDYYRAWGLTTDLDIETKLQVLFLHLKQDLCTLNIPYIYDASRYSFIIMVQDNIAFYSVISRINKVYDDYTEECGV